MAVLKINMLCVQERKCKSNDFEDIILVSGNPHPETADFTEVDHKEAIVATAQVEQIKLNSVFSAIMREVIQIIPPNKQQVVL